MFGRPSVGSRASRSFYEQLRSQDESDDLEQGLGNDVDEQNFREHFNDLHSDDIGGSISRSRAQDEIDPPASFDPPASLLIESNRPDNVVSPPSSDKHDVHRPLPPPRMSRAGPSTSRQKSQWEPIPSHQPLRHATSSSREQPMVRSVLAGRAAGGAKERAHWRWVNTSNLDGFINDVYNYFEGGGIWCILCSRGLWLLETLFVTVLLTFLSQCVDYSKLTTSKSLEQVVIKQCTRKMSGYWSLVIWFYSFFFIWKAVQNLIDLRRLSHVRDFYIHVLEIPEQDMQTISWQDIIARIMAIRDQNPKTATNIPQKLRKYMGSQSKERLDAHDIANRLMRKDNYLIAMTNKDIINLSLPVPFLHGRQLFSKALEWNLKFCILDMAFNDLGQVHQDFLRADRRGLLSQKMKARMFFAACMNLLCLPVWLAYVLVVFFFTYYNEYQKDPKLATARHYTRLAEWKFREFNELPHIFQERLNMSIPFATRYIDQFPKRMTEDVARTVAFMTGALTTVLALLTLLDSELFLGFEITKDRTVLFYLGIFGTIWAVSRGMVSEEAQVFNPEYAMRSVAEYTHYMPSHWEDRLHSFEVKKEFAELFKMKVVIVLEEICGIVTTPLLLLITLPNCTDQIVDFFREFTVHVDGLGYVCSFAVFDFKKGMGEGPGTKQHQDVREGYYSTKHNKMAASYFGFIDNYVINPKTGIPGHMPQTSRNQFHPPPAFPGLQSPTLAPDMYGSTAMRSELGRLRSRGPGVASSRAAPAAPSPMASMLLDPHHQPTGIKPGGRRHTHAWIQHGGSRIAEEAADTMGQSQSQRWGGDDDQYDEDETGALGESAWQTSPGRGLSRDYSAANTEEPETGVLGLIEQLTQVQRNRRGM